MPNRPCGPLVAVSPFLRLSLQANVARRGADVNRPITTRDYPVMLHCRPVGKLPLADVQLHLLRLTRRQLDALEPHQLLGRQRHRCSVWRPKVDLRYFRTRDLTDVTHPETHVETIVVRMDLQVGVLEPGVGQAMAEREQGLDAVGVVPAVADKNTLGVELLGAGRSNAEPR